MNINNIKIRNAKIKDIEKILEIEHNSFDKNIIIAITGMEYKRPILKSRSDIRLTEFSLFCALAWDISGIISVESGIIKIAGKVIIGITIPLIVP